MNHEEENIPFNSDPNEFGLPEGYFQRSGRFIFNKVEWLEEHKNFPTLLNLSRKAVFRVPAAYFDRQAQNLELLHTPRLMSLKKQTVFAVPEAYFEEQEIRELAKVMELEKEPVLDFMSRQNPFKVEAVYFSEREKSLQTLLSKEKYKAKTIVLPSSRAWMAAAAVLVLALGLWFYNRYFTSVMNTDCGTVACIDKQDLLKSKALENLESEELYDLVNSKKLEEKLKKNPAKNSDTKPADSSHRKNAVPDDLLDEI